MKLQFGNPEHIKHRDKAKHNNPYAFEFFGVLVAVARKLEADTITIDCNTEEITIEYKAITNREFETYKSVEAALDTLDPIGEEE